MRFGREDFLILVIVFSLLFPPLPEISGLSLRLDDFVLLGIAPFYCLSCARIGFKNPLRIFLIFLFLALISTFAGYIVRNVPVSMGDFNEFIRMFKYVFVIITASSVEPHVFWRKYDKLMFFGGWYVIFLSFIEYFNLFNLNPLIGALYSVPWYHLESMMEGSRRIVITGGDPNIGGFIGMYFFVYYYLKVLLEKKYNYVFMTILLLLCIVATSSRTVFGGLVLMCGLFVLVSKGVSKKNKLAIIVCSILGILLLFLSQKFSYLTVGMEQMSSGENESLNTRYLVWEENLAYFKESIWLGWGPAKAIHSTVVDGEYVFLLVRYGIIGLGTLLLLLLENIKLTFNMKDLYGKYVFLITTIALIFMFTNNFFSGYQLFLTYIIVVTVVLNLRKHKQII